MVVGDLLDDVLDPHVEEQRPLAVLLGVLGVSFARDDVDGSEALNLDLRPVTQSVPSGANCAFLYAISLP